MWFHTDITRVSYGNWRGYVVEAEQFIHGATRHLVQAEARRIITETAGVAHPQVIWNEC